MAMLLQGWHSEPGFLRRLFDLNYFTIFVVAALRTDPVLQARLLAIRASAGLRYPQRIMRPPFAPPGFGMSTFWIWHNYSPKTLKSQISNLKFS
jgi:hypothetical protein